MKHSTKKNKNYKNPITSKKTNNYNYSLRFATRCRVTFAALRSLATEN